MPEYLSPGVYVEEIDAGPKPIAAVATSTAGAVGVTLRGPVTPTVVTSYGDFVRRFGGPLDLPDEATRQGWSDRGHYWQAAESVKAFFDEGGARLFFQRVVPSGAAESSGAFNGGLYATLAQDLKHGDKTLTLTHVFGVSPGKLDVLTGDGTTLGQVEVTAVDHVNTTLTLKDPSTISARRGRDLVAIQKVNALKVLGVKASSPGKWGDEISVKVMPMIGARRTLAAAPASGAQVSTKTTADAAKDAADIVVAEVIGALTKATPAGFVVRINGGAPVEVKTVADAAPDVKLTLAAKLPADLKKGAVVTVLRSAVTNKDVTVSGADRLYPGATVQLEGTTGAELLTVAAVAGSQVTLSAAPAKPVLDGDSLTIVEAEVTVQRGADSERFAGLRLANDTDPGSLIPAVNLGSKLVRLTAGGDYDALDLKAFPAVSTGNWAPLSQGGDALGSLTAADFIGADLGPGKRTGIQALEEVDEVAILFVPGMWDEDVRNATVVHCETLGDRFAILDPKPGLDIQGIQKFRSPIDTKFAALYYPWVEIRDPRVPRGTEHAPPSGFVAGLYARVDVARGVHKAPANETLRSIRGFAQTITKREQDLLNPQNINVLRAFPGRGNRVWGARVLTSDAAWRYVPVRRLFLMIEESIDEGTQWVVFEPNDEPLWARVRQTVERFLTTQWRLGALQGATAEEAFFVACDRTTMTQDDIDSGRLICQIGIAPVRPAEFVIFRIQQQTRELATT